MSLSIEMLRLSPKTSWWIQPTREAFREAMAQERERMALVPKTSLVMLEGPRKMSKPTRERGAE
jgi:hypothetical protein